MPKLWVRYSFPQPHWQGMLVILDYTEYEKRTMCQLKKITIPYLIVHGDQDLGVPVKEAEQIYSWSNKQFTEFLKVSGTGHTFDIKHPFEGPSKAFNNVLEKTLQFFHKSFYR